MIETERLRDAYHDLESALDARAADFAARGVVARREHLGEVCLTAQLWADARDARFEFRDRHDSDHGYAALRLVCRDGTLTLQFQAEGAGDFGDALGWAPYFDTLSAKLLIVEGLRRGGAINRPGPGLKRPRTRAAPVQNAP